MSKYDVAVFAGVVGFLLLTLALGTGAAWLAGLFNPMGYMGVAPWRVPAEARQAERERRGIEVLEKERGKR